jgi:hypothetical protein
MQNKFLWRTGEIFAIFCFLIFGLVNSFFSALALIGSGLGDSRQTTSGLINGISIIFLLLALSTLVESLGILREKKWADILGLILPLIATVEYIFFFRLTTGFGNFFLVVPISVVVEVFFVANFFRKKAISSVLN